MQMTNNICLNCKQYIGNHTHRQLYDCMHELVKKGKSCPICKKPMKLRARDYQTEYDGTYLNENWVCKRKSCLKG